MDRWLSISVRCPAGGGTYQQLLPRQHLTGAPYALFSKTAPWDGIMDKPMGFDDNIDNDTVYTAGDGLTLVGTQFQGKGTPYHNMVIVARVGGDFTSIQAALEYIEDDASPENHCLVYIAPGVYNEQVTMKPFIDIEGAGELTTKITFTGSDNQYAGTVVGANDAELRFLTVENTGSSTYATAIFNNNTSPRLTYVTASASGGTYNDGVYNYNSSSPMMMNVTASASGGTYNYGVNNYNSSSPMMMNVTASASGGTYINIGVNNYNSSSPMMTNVTVSASEGTYNYGVANTNSSSPTMVNVTANGSGGTYAIGVYNEFSSSTMTNVTASASNGASNVGIYNVSSSGSHTVMVNNSHITGSNYTIYNDNEFDVFVGASQLSGGAVHLGGGTVKCIGVYDENYNSAGFTTCP
jgi:hypothetical protein